MANWYKVTFCAVPEPGTGIDVWDPECYGKLIDEFFQTWDCPLVTKEYNLEEHTLKLTVAEETELTYQFFDSGGSISINDDFSSDCIYYGNAFTIWVIFSDTFFYFAHNFKSERIIAYLYEIVEKEVDGEILEDIYEGWGGGAQFQDIKLKKKVPNSGDSEDAEDETEYWHDIILNYNTEFKTIDYNMSRFFTKQTDPDTGEEKTVILFDEIDPNFVSCSAVPPDCIISFNETRFFSVDTNTLVALEPVEPYEQEVEDEDE